MHHHAESVPDGDANDPPDATRLTRNVGFLLGRARLRLSTLTNRKLGNELGISNVQAILLFMVATGEAASMKALAQSSGMDMASTSRTVATLEARGLIERVRASSDRRVTRLQLTVSGRLLAERFPTILDEVVDTALQSFDAVRKHALRDMLEDLILGLKDSEREFTPRASTTIAVPKVNLRESKTERSFLIATME
ncbi:MarR family winged helix-turn-helix transcriptional regulator [Paraburkholderia sp. DHOC27]|uniref:MarR family winged helix-turn-helix transcriptional regulator n=1 Tax=Paraburkholderia sp. DHOC27 TaxID=2303330 RepID=UPI000E3E773C|nr:MarR family winged helix-turn-helix transcriptional regulator [Paraburkholderia sp. DHOC27]RFU45466.1 MarR family transcriptional regulator [Paraburkholderia sp. DHOC27]